MAAHRQAQRTRGNPRQRTEAKLCLVKGLYEHGFSPEIVRELFNLMDWVLVLRGKFDYDFTRSLARKMVYINSVERYHRKIGRQEGLQEAQVAIRQAIATVLRSRWDVAPPDKLQVLDDTSSLQAALQIALDSKSYQDFLQLL